jgi:hypothetical protein
MLLPRSHAWTPRQRWLITTAVVLAIVLFGALVYSYERYHRGPGESALFGTWRDTSAAMDSVAYYRFNADHTFDLLIDSMGELSVLATGRWYAGGPNIYVRFSPDLIKGRQLMMWHIADISANEIRVRWTRDGAIRIWKRVDLPSPCACNETMQRRLPGLMRGFYSMRELLMLRKLAAASGAELYLVGQRGSR